MTYSLGSLFSCSVILFVILFSKHKKTMNRLQCVGAPQLLKQRYAQRYTLKLNGADKERMEGVERFVAELAPTARLVDSSSTIRIYHVPRDLMPISTLFDILTTKGEELGTLPPYSTNLFAGLFIISVLSSYAQV